MRRLISVAGALTLLLPMSARGDGGVVRVSQAAGPFTVTVFTAPTPLRAGPIDVSVLVQDARGEAVTDATVAIALRQDEASTPAVRGAATREQATNKLLYAALLDLPAAGRWRVEVAVARHGTPASLAFDADAEPPLPRWRAYWPYLALAPIAIAIYALHQWLVLRRR